VNAAAEVDLGIVKSGPARSEKGSVVEYGLIVRNASAVAGSTVVVEDTLPAGFVFQGATGASCTAVDRVVSCALGTVPAGGSVSITLRARSPQVLPDLPSGQQVPCYTAVNVARVRGAEPDPVVGNNQSQVSGEFCDAAPVGFDLALTVQPTQATVGGGQVLEATIRVENLGPGNAPPQGVVRIVLPSAAVSLVSVGTPTVACTATAVGADCVLPGVGRNEVLSIPLRLRGVERPAAGVVVATLTLSGDGNPANNEGRLSLTPAATGADVELVKRVERNDVGGGETARFFLDLVNRGPEPARGLVVEDTLPAGLSFAGAQGVSGPSAACTPSGSVVRCTLAGELAVNGTARIEVLAATPITGGSFENVATLTGSNDSTPGNNVGRVTLRVNGRSAAQVAQLLDQCAGDNGFARDGAAALAAACSDPGQANTPFCRALVQAAASGCAGVSETLQAIVPEEVLAESIVLRDFAVTQFFNIDARLSQLRGGAGGFSLSGLNLGFGRQVVPWSLVEQVRRALSGEAEAEFDRDLVSPWGFFVNGTISRGDQELRAGGGRTDVDFESRGITIGVDYRIRPTAVAGVALGLARFDTDVGVRSTLETRAWSLTGYGSYYFNERAFVDARVSVGNVTLESARQVRFTVGNQSVDRIARGESDAFQTTLAATTGYHINRGGWTATPNASLRWVRSTVDAYTEVGAEPFNVSYPERSYRALQFGAGIQVTRAISLKNGVITPQFDFSFTHDSQSDPVVIEAQLVGLGRNALIRLSDGTRDQNYANLGLGLVYVGANGRQLYRNYRQVVGYQDLSRGTLNLGGRFEF
jgi:uncharacterized repeat protein (TIGR01451 family)